LGGWVCESPALLDAPDVLRHKPCFSASIHAAIEEESMVHLQQTLISPEVSRSGTHRVLFDWKSSGAAMAGEWSITQRVLQGGVSEGLSVVELSNGVLTVWVLPERGMGIWKADLRGIPVGWNSPVKYPVHPRHVNLAARNGLGWVEGFNELLCRCGLSSLGPPGIDEGADSPVESQLTLHGRIANTPAHTVETGIDPEREVLWIRGTCDEACLFGPQLRLTSTLTLPVGGRSLHIRDEVHNRGAGETEFELLYHINIGRPFLEAGSRFFCPFEGMAPRDARAAEDIATHQTFLGPTAAYDEQVYFFQPRGDDQRRAAALLHNAAGDRGFSVEFNLAALPCFSLWKCTQPEADGYVTGLEPGTNFPNFKGFERVQGRVRRLAAEEQYAAELTIGIHDSAEMVSSLVERIAAVQGTTPPQIHAAPTAPFGPAV
jgi:hypothetical protein